MIRAVLWILWDKFRTWDTITVNARNIDYEWEMYMGKCNWGERYGSR